MWLIDAYRKENKIVVWIKTDKDIFIEKDYSVKIYADLRAKKFLDRNRIVYNIVKKKNYLRKYVSVIEIKIDKISSFERFIADFEKGTNYRIPLYNADIAPEQMFLYEHGLRPLTRIDENLKSIEDDSSVPLKELHLKVVPEKTLKTSIKKIIINNSIIEGNEKEILLKFIKKFHKEDPDVIVMDYGFSRLPYLVDRLKIHGLECNFHRRDPRPIRYKGGKTFYSYGAVKYRDYAVRLNGRFLVDSSTMVGTECEVDGIIELARLSGTRFQQVASRSFGSVFQTSLVREMVKQGLLVPYKEKPLDKPMTMFELLKSDRAGHTFDAKIGFHKNIAEIDFSSMYPWIIYNHNISADTILCEEGPFEHVPGIPVRISLKYKGLVPLAIKPILDRRMEYKKNPTSLNKARALGLKWVLVTSYGYLRFREFKLGLASSHMAICAFAREILISAMHLAEEKGYEVIHGIVDSLYIKGITSDKAKDFCRELELVTGIPVSFEGMFKWICFLPSVNEIERPVPTRYYGVFESGDIKVRGIEVRQRATPFIVKYFQQKCLDIMKFCNNKKEIIEKISIFCRILKEINISKLDKKFLITKIRISKTDYTNNVPQKMILARLKRNGYSPLPGQEIEFIYQKGKVVLPEEFSGKADVFWYRKLLVRSLFSLLQVFGISKEEIESRIGSFRQTKLDEYYSVKYYYVPIHKRYNSRYKLSEKELRKRLEKQGWTVWRGGSFNILKLDEVYPNVYRSYSKLFSLIEKYYHGKLSELQYLCHVHHGMPDLICFRDKEFKFVECKLAHEQLSLYQKKCILKLQQMGFNVEVHKLVDAETKVRSSYVYSNGRKEVIEKQMVIRTPKLPVSQQA